LGLKIIVLLQKKSLMFIHQALNFTNIDCTHSTLPRQTHWGKPELALTVTGLNMM
jgi:hypothetical protein